MVREYDPDAPLSVSASGELADLRDGTTAGDRTYAVTVAADEPDGAGIRRLSIEETGVGTTVSTDVPCRQTADDEVCPQSATATLGVDLSGLAAGPHTFRAIAEDDEGRSAASDPWTVIIDRTPPAFPADFTISADLDPTASTAIVDWDAGVDGVGDSSTSAAGYRYRYRRGTSDWSAWQDTALERAEVPESFPGETFDFQIAAIDDADNAAVPRNATVSVDGTGDRCQATASGIPSGCLSEEDDPLGSMDPLPDDFSDGAPELEDEPGADLIPETADARAAATSYPAYRYRIKIRRRYAGEPGDGLSTTIRRYNNSFVIGNAFDGWRFDLARRAYGPRFGYRAGRVYGGFGTCGWIRSGSVSDASDDDTRTGCSPYFRPSRGRFADGLNCQPRRTPGPNGEPTSPDCNRATLIQLQKNVTDVDFCLNVDPPPVDNVPTRCENKASSRLTPSKIRAGYKVSWRYVTNGARGKKGKFVLVEDSRHVDDPRRGRWGFIPRRAFRANLCTRDATSKYNCGAPDE